METTCVHPWKTGVLEVVGTLFKTKLITASLPKLTAFGLAGVWLLTLSFWQHAFTALTRPPQPSSAVEQHLDYDDQRITELKGDIASRLDRIEADRAQRREQSDARYKALREEIDSVKHDVTFLYGGGIIGTALVSLLLTLNIIKINSAEKKMEAHPPANILQDDFDQIATLMRHLQQAKENEHRRHPNKDWNR